VGRGERCEEETQNRSCVWRLAPLAWRTVGIERKKGFREKETQNRWCAEAEGIRDGGMGNGYLVGT
jgi:hypothetical protein